MKFLTFVDLHDDKKVLKEILKRASKKDIEFLVCAGDISEFGAGLRTAIRKFNELGKKMYIIPGNHETDKMFEEVLPEFNNCINFNRRAFEKEGYVFLGYGGGGFALKDPEFRKVARGWYSKYKNKKIILVTHAPPFGTKLDYLDFVSTHHVGNKDIRAFIERVKPKLVICGHLHENVGLKDKIGKVPIIHPGWEGMVIELN